MVIIDNNMSFRGLIKLWLQFAFLLPCTAKSQQLTVLFRRFWKTAETTKPEHGRRWHIASELHRASQGASRSFVMIWYVQKHHWSMLRAIVALKFAQSAKIVTKSFARMKENWHHLISRTIQDMWFPESSFQQGNKALSTAEGWLRLLSSSTLSACQACTEHIHRIDPFSGFRIRKANMLIFTSHSAYYLIIV